MGQTVYQERRSLPDASSLYRSPEGYAAIMARYEAVLQNLPVPYESLTLPTRYGETHVIAAGPKAASPVILLHALSANAATWHRQMPALARAYRVYAPDIIGMTGRSAPTRLPYGGPGYGLWLRDVLDALDLQQASMIGLGFSGWLIAKFSALAPERIAKAALLSPAGFLAVRWKYLIPVIWDVLFINDEQARRLSHTLLAPVGVPLEEEAAEALYLIIKHFKNQFEAPPLPDAELARLRAPTLILLGEHEDVWDPQAVIARARKVLPDLRTAEIVPKAGHSLIANQPEAVSTRILKFLNETA